jgi:4-hydroxy-tetrahydrodipicolinate synthase
VVAGTGTNATAESIELTRRAAETGVDGCMVVGPYYNKPGPRGQIAHFEAIANASPVPLILYNVPSRTGVNLSPSVVGELALHERIVAIKEASGSLDQATELLHRTDLTVLSGEDSLTLPMAAAGAHGVVSVAGHLVGREMVSMLALAGAGKREEAAALHRRLFPLVQALFLETNPAPVKAALARLGLIENELRLPLVPLGDEAAERLEKVMIELGMPG